MEPFTYVLFLCFKVEARDGDRLAPRNDKIGLRHIVLAGDGVDAVLNVGAWLAFNCGSDNGRGIIGREKGENRDERKEKCPHVLRL